MREMGIMEMRLVRMGRRGRGISELMGTLLMIAITLIAGVAVYGWVNSQAGVSESALGANAVKQANYYKESLVIVSVQFYADTGSGQTACTAVGSYTYCDEMAIAVYNNGGVGLTVANIIVLTASSTTTTGGVVPSISLSATYTSPSGWCPLGSPCSYTCGSASGLIPPAVVNPPSIGFVTGQGASGSPSQPVPVDQVPPTIYTLTLPQSVSSGSPCSNPATNWFVDGASYTVQLTGLYGNVVSTQVTANG